MVSKKRLYLFLGMFLLIVGIGVYAYTSTKIPNPGHGGDEVLVTINGFTMTLQEAIDYDFLVDCGPEPSESYTTSGTMHNAAEIWITVYQDGRKLQEFLSDGSSLCGNYCVSKYDGSLSTCTYFGSVNPGHYADGILVDVDGEEMTFQHALDEGKFCPVSHSYYACSGDDVYWFDGCGGMEDVKELCYGCELMEGCCGIIQSGVGPHASYVKVYNIGRCVGSECSNYVGYNCDSLPPSEYYECSGSLPPDCQGAHH